MDHLARLAAIGLFALAACVLALAPLRASAYGTVPQGTQFVYTAAGVGPQTSALAACSELANVRASQISGGATVAGVGILQTYENGNSLCGWTQTAISCNPAEAVCTTNEVGSILRSSEFGCPADSTLTGSTCVCNVGFQPTGTQCGPTNCQDVLNQARDKNFSWSGNTPNFCYLGCSMSAGAYGYQGSTNTASSWGGAIFTSGEGCQGQGNSGNGPGVNDGAGRCPTGQCPGTVNGTPVCVPCTTTSQGPSGSASAPPGSTPPTLEGAPPGATSSDQKTECDGQECKVTTTYRDGGGNIIGTKEERQPQESFCSQNPTLTICKEGAFNGACASGFTCNGDAVQCAMAREQHKRACEFFSPTGAVVDAGNAAADGASSPPGHPRFGVTAEAFGDRITTTDLLPGSCPGDFSVTLMGSSLNVPMSQLCTPLQLLGNAMVGVAMLAAAFIVFRR